MTLIVQNRIHESRAFDISGYTTSLETRHLNIPKS